MLSQARIPDVFRQPLVIPVFAPPLVVSRRLPLKFFKNTGGYTLVHYVVSQAAYVSGALGGDLRVVQTAKSCHLLVELVREHLGPLQKLVRDELLKDLFEGLSCPYLLVAGSFVNKGDDSYSGKAAN